MCVEGVRTLRDCVLFQRKTCRISVRAAEGGLRLKGTVRSRFAPAVEGS